jgi:hypothetical protein
MLLLIMLMGLLRMRLETGDVFGLGRLLWKQVRWRQFLAFCDTLKFTNVYCYSSGSPLALDCHYRRGPFNSTSGYSFALFLSAHRNFSSQVLMILNLNGSFSFSPAHQKTGIDRIPFG